jgi:hypothetical protein
VKRLGLATPGGFYFDGVPAGHAEIDIDANFQNHRRISTTVAVEVPEGDVGYVEIAL